MDTEIRTPKEADLTGRVAILHFQDGHINLLITLLYVPVASTPEAKELAKKLWKYKIVAAAREPPYWLLKRCHHCTRCVLNSFKIELKKSTIGLTNLKTLFY